jgi:hypothetical protein
MGFESPVLRNTSLSGTGSPVEAATIMRLMDSHHRIDRPVPGSYRFCAIRHVTCI